MPSTVGASPGLPGCREPASMPLGRTSAAFIIGLHLLLWPARRDASPHPTRPVLVHLFEPKFGLMSSPYSMSVRMYRGGLTFWTGAPAPAGGCGREGVIWAQRACSCTGQVRACIFIACHPDPPPMTGARDHSPGTRARALAATRISTGMLARNPLRPAWMTWCPLPRLTPDLG